jgi:hypothetical protein
MHSTTFTALARYADETSQVVVSVVEDVSANAGTTATLGAVILQTLAEDTPAEARDRFEFARFVISSDGEVAFEGRQNVYGNLSKAFKFLSDYTLDRRPMVYLESGVQVESRDGEKSAPPVAA